MRDRKIISDRSFPSDAEIGQFKNFEKVKSNHLLAKKLLMRKIWFGAGAAVTAAAVVTGMYLNAGKLETKKQETIIAAGTVGSYVEPPIKGLDIAYSDYRIDASTGGSITYSTGSVLQIPAMAFVDENNVVVDDSVTILYREFHTAKDIFVAGIPMNYDSAGKHMQLESAGMFEIKAYKNNKPLHLSTDKQIAVKLASNNADQQFDVYALDTVAKTWRYSGDDKVVAQDLTYKYAPKNTGASTVAARPAQVALPPEPQMPAKADDSRFKFKIEFEEKYFPELASFKNLQFEVVDKNFNYKFYKVEWEEMMLSAGQEPGTYIMKLHKEDTTVKVLVQPVLGKADYEKALREFEVKHAAYRAEVEKRAIEDNKKLSADAGISLQNRSMTLAQANRIAGASTYREFSIGSLGFHNIDAVINFFMAGINNIRRSDPPAMPEVTGAIDYSTVYVGIKGKATVLRYSRFEPIILDKKADCLIWTVTDEGQIAFFDENLFRDNPAKKRMPAIPTVASDQMGALERISSLNG